MMLCHAAPVVYNYAVASVSLVHDQEWLPVLDTGSILWLLASVFTTSNVCADTYHTACTLYRYAFARIIDFICFCLHTRAARLLRNLAELTLNSSCQRV